MFGNSTRKVITRCSADVEGPIGTANHVDVTAHDMRHPEVPAQAALEGWAEMTELSSFELSSLTSKDDRALWRILRGSPGSSDEGLGLIAPTPQANVSQLSGSQFTGSNDTACST